MPEPQTCRVVAASRLADTDLPPTTLDPADVVSGSPATRELPLEAIAGVEVGIWQHTAGVSRSVEGQEVFVVLSGRATIEVADGPTLDVAPGDLGVLAAGAQTVWTVHETLRKVYVSAL